MVVVAAAKPHVAAIVRRHNAILRAAHARIDGSLEEKLAALIQPILEKAGNQAAARFQKLATNHLTAALNAASDAAALRRVPPGMAEDGFFGYRLRPFALTASAPTPNSAMVCVKPRPEEAADIAWPDGETAESLHVTLVYLGPVDGSLQEIADALAPVAASHAPLEGVVGGVGKFQPPGVAILLPDVPGLVELRVAITEALVEQGIFYARDHGFEAHVSIDAAPDPDTLEEALARTAQKPLHFDSILIVRGDSEVVEVPLIGPRPVTASGLCARCNGVGGLGQTGEICRNGQLPTMACPACSFAFSLAAAGEYVGWTGPAGDELIDVDKLVASLRTKTDPVRMAVLKSSMDPALKEAGISFDVSNPLTAKVLAQSGSQVKGIAETTQLNVMRIIDRSYNQGLSIPDTAKAIRAGMSSASDYRARTIARTELAGAANGGSLAATMLAAGALGVGFYKQWLTAPGASHPRHEDYDGLDGQTVGLEDDFDVGGESLQFPGDPDGSPEETINCRCALAYTETPPEGAAVTAEPEDGLSDEGVSDAGTSALAEVMPLTAPAGDTVSVGVAPFVPSPVVDRIKALGLDKPLKDVRPTTEIGREVYAQGPTTEDLFMRGGEWTQERQQIHADIVAKHFEGKAPPAAGSPKTAIFTSGGGASGKGSTMIDIGDRHFPLSELEDHPERFPDVVLMNPDIIKAMLPEYEQLRNAGDLYAASGVHEESSAIGKVVADMAQKQGYNVVIDTTGSSSSFVGKLEQAVKDGYEVKVRMVSVPTNEAVVRAMARGDRSGRYVAIDPLKGAHRGASAQLAIWKDMPNLDWQLFDNTDTRVLVAEKKAGEPVVIHDQAKWEQILAKANETSAAPGSALGVETKAVEAPAVAADVRTVADIVPGPDAETLAHVQSYQQTRLDGFAANYPVGQFGTSVNEIRDGYRAAVDQKIADLTAAAEVRVRVSPHILDKIVDDGRFKSQFEVEHSGGAFNRILRSQAEQTMFGYSRDLPVEERPIYGYLFGSTSEDGSISQYGPIIIRLTDAAARRSTFTLTDSLGAGERRELAPVALADGQVAGKTDAFSTYTTKDPLKATSLDEISDVYAEAQVHGGVTLADIAAVIIPKGEIAYRLEGLNRDIGLLEDRVAREQRFIDIHGEAAAQVSARQSIARLSARLADYQAQAALLVDDAAALRAKLATAGIKATLS